jgi:hypothetical protein
VSKILSMQEMPVQSVIVSPQCQCGGPACGSAPHGMRGREAARAAREAARLAVKAEKDATSDVRKGEQFYGRVLPPAPLPAAAAAEVAVVAPAAAEGRVLEDLKTPRASAAYSHEALQNGQDGRQCLARRGSDELVAEVPMQGWAYSGGGRSIVRVDVSADGGETWHTAELEQGSEQAPTRSWAWTFWSADVPVTRAMLLPGQRVELCCRATDASYNVQPERAKPFWNKRGLNNTAWHRVIVALDGDDDDDEKEEEEEEDKGEEREAARCA